MCSDHFAGAIVKLEAALGTEIDNEEPTAYEKMAVGALADLERPVAS